MLQKTIAGAAAGNLFIAMQISLDLLFLIRVLHVRPALAALFAAVGSLGGIVGGILRITGCLPAVGLPAGIARPDECGQPVGDLGYAAGRRSSRWTLGAAIGIRPSIWIAYAGSWAAGFLVYFSPLRRVRDVADLPAWEPSARQIADSGRARRATDPHPPAFSATLRSRIAR